MKQDPKNKRKKDLEKRVKELQKSEQQLDDDENPETDIKPLMKNKGGRPLADVDPDRVFELAAKGLTPDFIAIALGISKSTLYARFSYELQHGKAARFAPVLEINYKKALRGEDKAIDREFKLAGVDKGDQPSVNINIGNSASEVDDDELLNIIEGEEE